MTLRLLILMAYNFITVPP